MKPLCTDEKTTHSSAWTPFLKLSFFLFSLVFCVTVKLRKMTQPFSRNFISSNAVSSDISLEFCLPGGMGWQKCPNNRSRLAWLLLNLRWFEVWLAESHRSNFAEVHSARKFFAVQLPEARASHAHTVYMLSHTSTLSSMWWHDSAGLM